MKTFEVTTMWSTTPDCFLSVDSYADNGHVAISVWSESEGPFAGLTVNLPETKNYPTNYAFVDTNNFPEAPEMIRRLRIGKYTGRMAVSGYCMYPLYQFDETALKEWAMPEGE